MGDDEPTEDELQMRRGLLWQYAAIALLTLGLTAFALSGVWEVGWAIGGGLTLASLVLFVLAARA